MKNIMRFATNGLSGLNFLRAVTHADTCKEYSGTWLIVMLLVVFMAGCNGPSGSLGEVGGAAPIVSSTVPADGATNVVVDATINATFSKAMDSATITSATFTVAGGATPVTGTVLTSADGLTATFTPISDLATDTEFTATLTTGAKDQEGNAMAANKVWSFTTGSAPTVSSTVPADGATNVAVDAAITAIFSEAMDPLTISATTFTVLNTTLGGTAVAGGLVLSADGKTAVFTPTANLTAGTTEYAATITTGVTDLSGNQMTANYVWSFTTIP